MYIIQDNVESCRRQLERVLTSQGGTVLGETEDFSYNVVSDPVHVHDLQATILHCLGLDHTKLTFLFQGRHFRLTDVSGSPVKQLLA